VVVAVAAGEPNSGAAEELLPAPPAGVEPKLKPALGFVDDKDEGAAVVEAAAAPNPNTGFALGLLVEAAVVEVPKVNFAAPPEAAGPEEAPLSPPPGLEDDDEADISDPKVFFATAGPPKGDGVDDPCCCLGCLSFSAWGAAVSQDWQRENSHLFVTMHTSHFQQTPDTVDDDGATAHFTDDQVSPEEEPEGGAAVSVAVVDKLDSARLSSTPAVSSSASPNTQRTYQSTKASCVSTPPPPPLAPPAAAGEEVTRERSALPCTSSQ
jgi:hypothetical protein